jgi:alpha-beta hydrolase superfamily lysophospholipase
MADGSEPIRGVAGGVPFVALAPAGPGDREAAPLVVVWHLNDPPRSAEAMAAALPLAGLAAWRVYLDLPMHGRRQLPGGLDEFMRLGYQDAVLKAFEPQVAQAVAEFPAVLSELRGRLPVTDAPIGVVGASVGALPAQLVMVEHAVPVSVAALVSPVVQLAEVVAVNERRFAVSYPWSDASRAVAARFDFVARAAEIAARDPQPAILLVTGGEDDPAFPLQAQRLQSELHPRYSDPQRVRTISIPAMKHAIADEPGIEPAPPTEHAQRVDAALSEWFARYLI